MSDEFSNIDEVCAKLNEIIDGFGFDLIVGDRDLGRDCVGIFAQDVYDRASQGQGSEGEWAPNSDEPDGHGYASMKERVYGVFEQPNVRTGQMISLTSLSHATISHDEVNLSYGWGVAPSESTHGGRVVKKADERITDREKAKYAHEGQGPHGTKRPFYVLHDTAIAAITDRCQDRLDDYAFERWNQ